MREISFRYSARIKATEKTHRYQIKTYPFGKQNQKKLSFLNNEEKVFKEYENCRFGIIREELT